MSDEIITVKPEDANKVADDLQEDFALVTKALNAPAYDESASENRRVLGKLRELIQRASRAELNIQATLDLIPEKFHVRMREGGGTENIAGSLAISVAKLANAAKEQGIVACELFDECKKLQSAAFLCDSGNIVEIAARNSRVASYCEEWENRATQAEAKVAMLEALLNTPEIEDFDKAVPLEAAHQVNRWGVESDAGKKPSDWLGLVVFLAAKAYGSHDNGNMTKAKHHCVSTAAALRNWHAHIRSGASAMRPGYPEETIDG
jgi:hypothetical protein